ncbi:MAG: DUF4327 family protein [Microcystaceae cyanobacterium]
MQTLTRYTINDIKEEAQFLVHQGRLSRQQSLYSLCQFLPSRQWQGIECELEKNDYLLRDRLIDLLENEVWSAD